MPGRKRSSELMLHSPLINTPLQRGDGTGEGNPNRVSGFHAITEVRPGQETAEAVHLATGPAATPLKRGVNERGTA